MRKKKRTKLEVGEVEGKKLTDMESTEGTSQNSIKNKITKRAYMETCRGRGICQEKLLKK